MFQKNQKATGSIKGGEGREVGRVPGEGQVSETLGGLGGPGLSSFPISFPSPLLALLLSETVCREHS